MSVYIYIYIYMCVSKITKLILMVVIGKNFSAYLFFFHTLQETESEALTIKNGSPCP